MQLVNGTDKKKVYKGTPEQLGFELAKLEFDTGETYSHTLYTKECIDSDEDIQGVYDLLEWLGFNVNDHEFVDGEGYIICGVPCKNDGTFDIQRMKTIHKNICLYLGDKLAKNEIVEHEYYQVAQGLRNTVSYWAETYRKLFVCA